MTRYIIRETYAPGFYTYIECQHVFAGMSSCRTYLESLKAFLPSGLLTVEVWSECPGQPRRDIASYSFSEEA